MSKPKIIVTTYTTGTTDMMRRNIHVVPNGGRQHGATPYARRTRAGVVAVQPNLLSDLYSDKFMNTEGGFQHWGWLNPSEIATGLQSLGLSHKIHVVQSRDVCQLPHLQVGTGVIFLTNHHYISVVNLNKKLIMFDPLNQPAERYFKREMKQLAPVGMHVQSPNNPYCGNFCLLFLHIVFRTVQIWKYGKDEILNAVRHECHKCFYTPPHNIEHNNMVVEMFTIEHRIGEEFVLAERYKKLQHYLSCLSRKALSQQ